MKGPFQKKTLSDWWFLKSKRTDGRSGHMYVCPIIMTLSMYIHRFKLRNTHSVNWEHTEHWLDTDENYEPARIIARPLSRERGGYTPPSIFPTWTINLEHNLQEKWRRRKWSTIEKERVKQEESRAKNVDETLEVLDKTIKEIDDLKETMQFGDKTTSQLWQDSIVGLGSLRNYIHGNKTKWKTYRRTYH